MNKQLFFIAVALFFLNTVFAQNTFEETMTYKEINGRIIIRANVGGEEGDFLLDPRGNLSLTKEAADKRKIEMNAPFRKYPREGFEVIGSGDAFGFFIGKNIYSKSVRANIIKNNELLQSLGVDGVIGFGSFSSVVLTINSKAKTITTSAPYKPAYIKLGNRSNAELKPEGVWIEVQVNGKPGNVVVDFYEEQPFRIPVVEHLKIENGDSKSEIVAINGMPVPGKDNRMGPGWALIDIKVCNEEFKDIKLSNDSGYKILTNTSFYIIGKPILNQGVISFDIAKGKYYFQPFGMGEDKAVVAPKEETKLISGKVNPIDRVYFLSNVYDYKTNKKWKTIGDKPVIIDFWAKWCGPCLRMMPAMEELAAKYKDQVIFYKVNVDKEGELRNIFDANAIPLLIFGPVEGEIVREVGADTKEKIENIIVTKLLKQQ